MPPEQAFDARSVLALDAYGGVDAESTGALPRKHALGVNFVEQAMSAEVAEHAALDHVLEHGSVLGREQGGLVEADLCVVVFATPSPTT